MGRGLRGYGAAGCGAAGRRGGGAAGRRAAGLRVAGRHRGDAQRVERDCKPGEAVDGAVLLLVVTIHGVVRLEIAPLLPRRVLKHLTVEALEGLREA